MEFETISVADAWCSKCGEYAVVSVRTYADCDAHGDNRKIVEEDESCMMCRGQMTLEEPKHEFKVIDP